MSSIVQITDMVNAMSFPVNGENPTAEDVINTFLDAHGLSEDASNVVRLTRHVGNAVSTRTLVDLAEELQAGDVLIMYPSEVAKGGAPGACIHSEAFFESEWYGSLDATYRIHVLDGERGEIALFKEIEGRFPGYADSRPGVLARMQTELAKAKADLAALSIGAVSETIDLRELVSA